MAASMLTAAACGFGALYESVGAYAVNDVIAQRTDAVCGDTWQKAYAELHMAAEFNKSAPLLVFDAFGSGGLADRLTGMMTSLLLAILTDRAFVLMWSGYEEALTMPRFLRGSNEELLRRSHNREKGEFRAVEWFNQNRKELFKQVTRGKTLGELWPERIVQIRSNRGFTQQLLASPAFAAAVAAKGLTPANAQFGCLFNFLLQPTEAAVQPLGPILADLRAPHHVIVGVHVRTGDSAFTNTVINENDILRQNRGKKLFEDHKFIFEYAWELGANITAARNLPPSVKATTRLLLLGDSNPLREHALSVYGDRLIVSNVTVQHVAKALPPTRGGWEAEAKALLSSVGEHWMYSYADAFAYSSHSGFPRTAAARALRDDAIHTCFHYEGPTFNAQPTARECTGPYTVATLGERHAAGL